MEAIFDINTTREKLENKMRILELQNFYENVEKKKQQAIDDDESARNKRVTELADLQLKATAKKLEFAKNVMTAFDAVIDTSSSPDCWRYSAEDLLAEDNADLKTVFEWLSQELTAHVTENGNSPSVLVDSGVSSIKKTSLAEELGDKVGTVYNLIKSEDYKIAIQVTKRVPLPKAEGWPTKARTIWFQEGTEVKKKDLRVSAVACRLLAKETDFSYITPIQIKGIGITSVGVRPDQVESF